MINDTQCKNKRLKRIEKGAFILLLIILACSGTVIYLEHSRITRSLDHAARAEKYFKEGKIPQSISELEKSIQVYPYNPGVYEELAALWSIKKEYDKAIEVYHTALRKIPRKAILHQELSKAYYMKKDYCHAVQSLEKAESLDSEIDPKRLLSLYRQEHGKMPSHKCILEKSR